VPKGAWEQVDFLIRSAYEPSTDRGGGADVDETEETATHLARTVRVRCAGETFLGDLISARSEWSTTDSVLVSFVLQLRNVGGGSESCMRFYLVVPSADAWARAFDADVVEAEAMKREDG
jgi:hypothetical protein